MWWFIFQGAVAGAVIVANFYTVHAGGYVLGLACVVAAWSLTRL